jgi:hypothetical protein
LGETGVEVEAVGGEEVEGGVLTEEIGIGGGEEVEGVGVGDERRVRLGDEGAEAKLEQGET